MANQLSFEFDASITIGEWLVQLPDVGPWDAGAQEHDLVDFKETPATSGVPKHALKEANKRFRRSLVEDAVCFANSRGGHLIIGVRDRAGDGEPVVAGVNGKGFAPDELREMIYQRTAPHLLVDAYVETVLGAPIIIIRVPRGNEIHGTVDGVFKFRQGNRCVPLDEPTMRALRAARGTYDWSAEPTTLGVEGVSRAALEEAASRLRTRGRDDLAEKAEQDPAQYLRDLGLLSEDGLTRAAILLYGTEAALHSEIAGWGVLMTTAASPGSEGQVLMRKSDTRRPLVLLLDDLLDRLRLLSQTTSLRAGAEQIELVDYPPDALREIIVNAFVHRDWEASGLVTVNHSPDELTVGSPGGLLPTLDVTRLLRESAARNSLLAREMSRLGLVEQAGMGFDRVFRELARIGKPPPQLHDGPSFTVTMIGGEGDRTLAKYVASGLPGALRTDVDALLVLTMMTQTASLTNAKVAPVLQRSIPEAQRVLARMAAVGVIEPTRSTAKRQAPSYRLAPAAVVALRNALRYRTETIDSDDKKLIRHLQRNGQISNADVRDYLDCDSAIARNRLQRLRNKKWIDFAPDSPKRGPEVRYIKLEKLDEDVVAEGA